MVVSAVGPYARLGSVAVEAAIDAGCAYVDCAGEPVFLRNVFEQIRDRGPTHRARLLPRRWGSTSSHSIRPGRSCHRPLPRRRTDRNPASATRDRSVRPQQRQRRQRCRRRVGPLVHFSAGSLQSSDPVPDCASSSPTGPRCPGCPSAGFGDLRAARLDPDLTDISAASAGRDAGHGQQQGGSQQSRGGCSPGAGVGSAMGAVLRATALGGLLGGRSSRPRPGPVPVGRRRRGRHHGGRVPGSGHDGEMSNLDLDGIAVDLVGADAVTPCRQGCRGARTGRGIRTRRARSAAAWHWDWPRSIEVTDRQVLSEPQWRASRGASPTGRALDRATAAAPPRWPPRPS